jgi:hypothetical protein
MINIEIYLEDRLLSYTQDYLLEQPIRIVESRTTKVATFEGEITFINETYSFLMDKLVDNPIYANTGLVQGIPIRIVDLCDNKTVFVGEIRADTLDFCDRDCFITATPINASPQKRFIDFFESTYISEPISTREQINHPKMMYAQVSGGNATGFLIGALIFIARIILGILDIFYDIIRTLLNILTLGTLSGKFKVIDLTPVIRALNDAGTGLAFYHPTPYIRTYINETIALVNQKAGTNITFKSSIFDFGSPYYDTVYLYSDYNIGRDIDFNRLDAVGLITNEPLKTGADLLDELKTVFNADWRLIGNELIFERKDFFEQVGVDIRQFKTCYTLRDAPLPQAIEIKYSDDGSNTEANTNGYYDYFELWNKEPFSPRQKGLQNITIPFGRSRQLYDEREDFSFTGKELELLKYFVTQTGFQLLTPDRKLTKLRNERPPLLVMDNGRLSNPCLLIIREQQDPFWGNLILNNNRDYYGKNLYDRFYEIDNPRGAYMRNRKPLNFSTEELPIGIYNVYDKVQISKGFGYITDVEYEYFPDRKVTIRGEM